MQETDKDKFTIPALEELKQQLPKPRRGPGRGIGEKRLKQQYLSRLNLLFKNLQQVHGFLIKEGHLIINESGSLLASQDHQNLKHLLNRIEDFLWVLNCAIARHGGIPRLI